MTDFKKFNQVTETVKGLYWLPIETPVIFKCLLISCKALNLTGPSYLREMLPTAKPKRDHLQSSDDPLCLEEPRTRLKTYGDQALSVATIKAGNDLPFDIRMVKAVDSFVSKLKTHLIEIVHG